MKKEPWDLKARTMLVAVDIFRFCRQMPWNPETRDVLSQLRRASSSTASNYRASKRGRSDAEFISKLGQSIEEADESLFWLEFACAIGMCTERAAARHIEEAGELVAILTASHKTAKLNAERKTGDARPNRC